VRLLFASTSGHGHLRPLLTLWRAAEDLGHETLVVAPRGLETTLESLGASYRLGPEPAPDEARRLWSAFAELGRTEASRLVEREWFAGLCARAMLAEMRAACEQWRPHVVVRESCEYSSAVTADEHGIALAQVAISTSRAEASVLTRLVAPDLDRFATGLAERVFATPYITRFPASMDPSAFPSTWRYRGGGGAAAPLPRWWANDDDPLVYLTFGTVAGGESGRAPLLRDALDEISPLGVRVLVTTGPGTDPSDLGRVPANVRVRGWVDQARVLAEASVVVCHGGSGTTFGALEAGVPLVLLPLFADQPTNAALVVAAGAGVTLHEGARSANANAASLQSRPGRLRDAVREVLGQPRFAEAARRIGEEMAAASSPEEIIAQLAARA
jgi:UDP:flavonoid glycosyltransferase YjiC (YdhE family)